MRLLFIALAIFTFSASSFAKVYECWGTVTGRESYRKKFSLDTEQYDVSKVARQTIMTVTGRIVAIEFRLEATRFSPAVMSIYAFNSVYRSPADIEKAETEVEDSLEIESRLLLENDYTARMGCTLVKE